MITLHAQQDCWVEAAVDGQTALRRLLVRGESATLEAHGQILLSVGNAGGLSLQVDQRPGVALGRQGEVRRNIVITKESLPALLEDPVRQRPSDSG